MLKLNYCFILFCFFLVFPFGLYAQNTHNEVNNKIYHSLNIQDTLFKEVEMLDTSLLEYQFILLGETHDISNNQEVGLYFINYLLSKGKKVVLVNEIGVGNAFILEKDIINDVSVDSIYTKNIHYSILYSFLNEYKNYYKSLKKIKKSNGIFEIKGIDFDFNNDFINACLHLLKDISHNNKCSILETELSKIKGNIHIHGKEYIRLKNKLKRDLIKNTQNYKNILKDNFDFFKILVCNNTKRSLRVRDYNMYKNILKLKDTYKDYYFVISLGSDHVSYNNCFWQQSVAKRLSKHKDLKIIRINRQYEQISKRDIVRNIPIKEDSGELFENKKFQKYIPMLKSNCKGNFTLIDLKKINDKDKKINNIGDFILYIKNQMQCHELY